MRKNQSAFTVHCSVEISSPLLSKLHTSNFSFPISVPTYIMGPPCIRIWQNQITTEYRLIPYSAHLYQIYGEVKKGSRFLAPILLLMKFQWILGGASLLIFSPCMASCSSSLRIREIEGVSQRLCKPLCSSFPFPTP